MSLISLLGITFWDIAFIIGVILVILSIIIFFTPMPKIPITSVINLYLFLAGISLMFFSSFLKWVFDDPLRIFVAVILIVLAGAFFGLFMKGKK